MNHQLPPPVVCGMFGACAGLVFGNCQIFPVWVGAATGGSVGCLMCIVLCIANPQIIREVRVPVGQIVHPEQPSVQHIHLYEVSVSGAPKLLT